MQPVRLCILSNKQIWMMLVVVKVVRSARCSPLLIKWPPPISHYLVCCRFTMTWSVSDSQLSWVTIMGLFSLSPPPNYFQMLGCNLQREWKDLCMVTILWYVCVCIHTCMYVHMDRNDLTQGSETEALDLDMMTSEQRLLIIVLNIFYCWPFFNIDREKTLIWIKLFWRQNTDNLLLLTLLAGE